MDVGLLRAARRLLKSGKVIEAELAATLFKCDAIGHHLTYVVSDTLTKLVQDLAGAPLVLSAYVSDPRAMICLISVLNAVLQDVHPERTGRAYVARAERRARLLCANHHLPKLCGDVFAILAAETCRVFRELDQLLAPPRVRKATNAETLRRRLRHFYRAVRPEVLAYAFNSLKLSVCMKAAAAGCFRLAPEVKSALHATLHRIQQQARTMAAVNDVHRDNVIISALLVGPSGAKG